MTRKPFAFVELDPRRSHAKPRRKGLTLISDWGLGPEAVRDLLRVAGPYLDIAKIATGTARLYDEDTLRQKLELYRSHGVRPYLGGQFQEYVFANYGEHALKEFLGEARRLGFTAAELSENYVTLTTAERRRQVELLLEFGFEVYGEVGSKHASTDAATLIAQIQELLTSGVSMALVEGAELMADGGFRADLFTAIRDAVDTDRVMFELPTVRIGVSPERIHDIKKMLIREVGPDVSIANLHPDDIIETESLRLGLGVVGPSSRLAAAHR